MCGRFYFTMAKDDLARYLPEVALPETLPRRYNIAPTQQAPVLITRDGARRVALFRWGLIPSWAKDARIGSRYVGVSPDQR